MSRAPEKRMPWSAEDVFSVLASFYRAPEWALLGQVRDGTGWSAANRYADAIAMNLWPSRGMELIGFEIKVNRSDWLSELRNPQKSEAVQSYCDRWYLAIPEFDDGHMIARSEEMPVTWGLILTSSKGIKHAKEAPKLNPTALDRAFVASVLRNVVRPVDDGRLRAEFERGVAFGRSNAKAGSLLRDLEELGEQKDKLRHAADRVERISTDLEWSVGRLRSKLEREGTNLEDSHD